MRIIPKKIKVKNTVWKCYSMKDILVALVVFSIIFIMITAGNWGIAIVLGLISVVMFMPTADGIFYSYIFENLRFVFSKKKEYSELEVNQDVIYYSEEKDIYIVHRIYKDNLDGTYQMKGINNTDVDDEYLTEDNYVASVVKVVTLLNAGTTMMNNKSLIFIFIIVIFLFLY